MFGNLEEQIFFQDKNQMFVTEAILMMVPTKVKRCDIIYQQNR